MEEKVSPIVEYGLLLMIVISSVNCIARADFNFVFSLATYYLWITLSAQEPFKDSLAKKTVFLNLGLSVLDLICLVFLTSAWGDEDDPYAGIHGFVLMTSWVNFFLRVIEK